MHRVAHAGVTLSLFLPSRSMIPACMLLFWAACFTACAAVCCGVEAVLYVLFMTSQGLTYATLPLTAPTAAPWPPTIQSYSPVMSPYAADEIYVTIPSQVQVNAVTSVVSDCTLQPWGSLTCSGFVSCALLHAAALTWQMHAIHAPMLP